jgi:hypothetical protein
MTFHGFGVGLTDFAAFWLFAFLADHNFLPASPHTYRWVWFLGCVILALLFFLAWLTDLGAHF